MGKLTDEDVARVLNATPSIPKIQTGVVDVNVSLDDVERFGDKQSISKMYQDISSYNKMLKQKITFINPALTAAIPFTRENLYLICAYTGNGKCFQKGQGIMMFDGSTKKVEDVIIGDQLMGPDSKPRNVLSLARGKEQMYEVIPTKGDKYTVNESHMLSLKYTTRKKAHKEHSHGDIINVSVKDYLQKSKYFKHVTKGYRVGVDFPSKDVELDPYYLGLWLGDGNSENTGISTIDSEIIDYLYDHVNKINKKEGVNHFIRKSNICYHTSTGRKISSPNRNRILNNLKDLDLINNKHIPTCYKINDKDIRLQLLAGIIDSDGGGTVKDGFYDVCFKNKTLAYDTVFLARSLGFASYIKEVQKKCTNSKTLNIGTYYRLSISGHTDKIPVKVSRKKRNKRKQIKDVLNVGIKVVPTKVDNYYGFGVDGDHLFLLDDFTVTHNSTIAANISYPLWKEGKKTLVISNEEPQQDVMYRIACLELGYNFNDYKKGTMPMAHQKDCALLFPEISKHVKVIDVNYKSGLSTKIEGVKNALEAVKNADYSAVMIDYFQLIQYSVADPQRSRYNVLNDLRIWLGQYIRSSNIPVVMFAQLHSMAKRTNVELDSRIKECPGILEPATVVIEVVPDFENKTSTFLLKKDRFGYQGMRIECGFNKGKYIEMTAEHILATQQSKVDELVEKVADGKDS